MKLNQLNETLTNLGVSKPLLKEYTKYLNAVKSEVEEVIPFNDGAIFDYKKIGDLMKEDYKQRGIVGIACRHSEQFNKDYYHFHYLVTNGNTIATTVNSKAHGRKLSFEEIVGLALATMFSD